MKYGELNKILIGLTAVSAFCASLLHAETDEQFKGSFYCVAEAVGGVYYDETETGWTGTSFKATGRYILNILVNSEVEDELGELRPTYLVSFSEHGSNSDAFSSSCYTNSNVLRSINPLSSFIKNGSFSCSLLHGELHVNLNSQRFLRSYQWGFVDGVDNNQNTPFIEIGICSKLD